MCLDVNEIQKELKMSSKLKMLLTVICVYFRPVKDKADVEGSIPN